MAFVPVPKKLTLKDMAGVVAGSWTPDAAGDDYPSMCRASLLQGLAIRINKLLGMGRVHFSQHVPAASGYDSGTDAQPLWQFRINDYHDNGRNRKWSVLALPRTTAPGGGGDALAHRNGDTADTTSIMASGTTVASSVAESDTYLLQFLEARGNPTDSVDTQGLDADAGMRVIGLTVQDQCLNRFDSSIHNGIQLDVPKIGDDVIADRPEDLRAKLHHLRSECLPAVAWWSANDPTGSNQPASSDWTGYQQDAASYTNIIDDSSTSRTATTPGISVHCQYANRGNSGYGNNKRVHIAWYVLAEVGAAGDGDVQVVGPLNTVSVNVTATTPTWYSVGTAYGDATIADDNATTSRNKFDIMARETTGGDIWIYGWAAFMIYA